LREIPSDWPATRVLSDWTQLKASVSLTNSNFTVSLFWRFPSLWRNVKWPGSLHKYFRSFSLRTTEYVPIFQPSAHVVGSTLFFCQVLIRRNENPLYADRHLPNLKARPGMSIRTARNASLDGQSGQVLHPWCKRHNLSRVVIWLLAILGLERSGYQREFSVYLLCFSSTFKRSTTGFLNTSPFQLHTMKYKRIFTSKEES
jgi:hypothetical protein